METNPSLTLSDRLMKSTGAKPGIYTLALRLEKTYDQQVGRLGSFTFPPGSYLYVGSARGPGGVAARVGRHIQDSIDKPRHWHIDWLRQIAEPTAVIWTYNDASSECLWAQTLSSLGARWPAGFGASDCGCPGHLIRLEPVFVLDSLHQNLSNTDETDLQMAYL